MILVQNLLQRLNGNKSFLFILLVSIFGSSCDTVRVASKPRQKKSQQVQKKKRTHVKVDTVEWTKDPLDKDDPISDDLPFDYGYNLKSKLKSSYNVAILLPMRSNMNANKSSWSKSSIRFINYYGGIQMALEDLKREGIKLNVDIFDSEYSLTKVKKLWTTSALKNADIVVGPYHRKALIYSAEKAKNREVTLVSPWISSPNITSNNPFYVQAKSGLSSHYQTILENVLNNFDKDRVFVLIKQGDDEKRKEIENIYASMTLDKEINKLEFLELIPDTVKFGKNVIDTLLFRGKKETAFVLPYTAGKDKEFVYNFVRKYELLQGEDHVTLYGLYKWLDFSEEMYEYFNRLDLRLSVSGLVNTDNLEVRQFKQRYYSKFGAFPTRDAYEAYDLIKYTGKSLKQRGNKFHITITEDKDVGLQTAFTIKPIINLKGEFERVSLDYFENNFVEIVGYENYQFKILN